jgi:histone H3/H4
MKNRARKATTVPATPKSSKTRRLTINVGTSARELTDKRISEAALMELVAYVEMIFIPRIMFLAAKFADREGKGTIQERDFIRARDLINHNFVEVTRNG